MFGPAILCRSLSIPSIEDKFGNLWQYHSRSDHHSKIGCWGIVVDLLLASPVLRGHVERGHVGFGINHEMADFRNNRKKNLDLVLCRPSHGTAAGTRATTLVDLVDHYRIDLTAPERDAMATLPTLPRVSVGAVLVALEAKACMTAHQRALPRLYDELNSSHLTIHGATGEAIAAGFVMINLASEFASPDRNKATLSGAAPVMSAHNQPRDARLAIGKVEEISRRSGVGEVGYDAIGITVISCRNDGSRVELVADQPAPPAGDIFHYQSMIQRIAHLYATRHAHV